MERPRASWLLPAIIGATRALEDRDTFAPALAQIRTMACPIEARQISPAFSTAVVAAARFKPRSIAAPIFCHLLDALWLVEVAISASPVAVLGFAAARAAAARLLADGPTARAFCALREFSRIFSNAAFTFSDTRPRIYAVLNDCFILHFHAKIILSNS